MILFIIIQSLYLRKTSLLLKLKNILLLILVFSLSVTVLILLASDQVFNMQLESYINIGKVLSKEKAGRFSEWIQAMNLIGENSAFGLLASTYRSYSKSIIHPHSLFLEFLLYSGLPIFLFMFTFILSSIFKRSGFFGIVLFFSLFPLIGPGSTGNSSWMLITSLGLAILLLPNNKQINFK